MRIAIARRDDFRLLWLLYSEFPPVRKRGLMCTFRAGGNCARNRHGECAKNVLFVRDSRRGLLPLARPKKPRPGRGCCFDPGALLLRRKILSGSFSYLGGLPSVTITKLPLFTASPVSISRVFTWMTIVVLLTLTTRALETAN